MAKGDYRVAERAEWHDGPVTAGAKVAETVSETPDADNRAEAAAAGVQDAAFIGYGEALDAYASRIDIEGLDSKNRRNNPATFADADHMRNVARDAAPTPGNYTGVAPAVDAGDQALGTAFAADTDADGTPDATDTDDDNDPDTTG